MLKMCTAMKKSFLADLDSGLDLHSQVCVCAFLKPSTVSNISVVVMAAKANSQQMSIVQKDWENREFVEVSCVN